MTDGASIVSGAATSPSPMGNAEQILSNQQGREGDLKSAVADYTSAEAKAGDTEVKQLGALEGEAGKLVPPKLDVPPPPTPKTTDPHVVWGSLAMGLAALGSLMTRTPLTTAMNAAADVVTAYGKKDQAAANQAFDTWKIASDNAVKMADFQQKAYDEALSGIERREHMTIEERAQADREADAKLRGVMTAFGDQTGLARLESGGWQAVQHLQDQRQEWTEKFKLQLPKLEEQNAFMKAVGQMQQDPRFAQLGPVDQYRAIEAVKNSVAPSMMMKPAQKLQDEEKIQRDLKTDPIYKAWAAAAISSQEIAETMNGLKDGSISETIAADQFTQTFNGGRAIRGFQQQMLTNHASLWDQANILAKKVQNGGFLSDQQLMVMAQAAQMSADFLNRQMDATVLAAQARAMKMGLDPHAVVPDDYAAFKAQHPDNNPHGVSVPSAAGGKMAPPEAIAALKADHRPSAKKDFDAVFGSGAAEKALGE